MGFFEMQMLFPKQSHFKIGLPYTVHVYVYRVQILFHWIEYNNWNIILMISPLQFFGWDISLQD